MIEKTWRIYEFVEPGGRSTIGLWLHQSTVSEGDRGRLVQKMDMLSTKGTDLLDTILAGPIKSKRNRKMVSHIYKLVVHGDGRMLRPMLCRGPQDPDNEFTFLLGAFEVGGKLDEDAETAEERRQLVIADPSRREINGRYR
jgi:hypothetical protein